VPDFENLAHLGYRNIIFQLLESIQKYVKDLVLKNSFINIGNSTQRKEQ